eukprot:11221154-Alexandrium_andersonii.AAC.1
MAVNRELEIWKEGECVMNIGTVPHQKLRPILKLCAAREEVRACLARRAELQSASVSGVDFDAACKVRECFSGQQQHLLRRIQMGGMWTNEVMRHVDPQVQSGCPWCEADTEN